MEYSQLEQMLETEGIVFLTYGGFLTQPLISNLTQALEHEAQQNKMSLKQSSRILTIFIELSQNIMNYSQQSDFLSLGKDLKGLILVGYVEAEKEYFIVSRNVIDVNSKAKIEQRMHELRDLNKDELRLLYREKRRSGAGKHGKGAGIGFIEIARNADSYDHSFNKRDDGYYLYTIKVTVSTKGT